MKVHFFNIDLAVELGVECAILYQNLSHWCEINKANNRNFYENMYWTYNSVNAFLELFPYMTKHKITKALSDLESKGYIVSGNFNQSSYDRTKWYSCIQSFDVLKIGNGSDENQKPIPYINTYTNHIDNNIYNSKNENFQSKLNFEEQQSLKTEEIKKEKSCAKKERLICIDDQELTLEEAFKLFWDIYDKKTDTAKAKQKFFKLSDSDMVLAIKKANEYVLSTPDKKYRKNALTWLNGECWNDEVQKITNNQNNYQNGTQQQSNGKQVYQFDYERAKKALFGGN